MPVMGFDDERVRDVYWAEVERRKVAGDWQSALRAAVAEIERREAERAAAWLRLKRVMEEFAAAVKEAMGALLEVWEGLARACREAWGQLEEVAQAWGLIEDGARVAGRYKGPPTHVNCRCLPVERVDPVRAGRTRWWTRK